MNKKAFTLLELLVVVLIIGILAAVAVPQYKMTVEKSHATEALSILKTIAQAQEIYFLAKGEYASAFTDLDIDVPTSPYFDYTISYASSVATEKNNKYTIGFRYSHRDKQDAPYTTVCGAIHGSDQSAIKTAKSICQHLGADISKNESGLLWPIVE